MRRNTTTHLTEERYEELATLFEEAIDSHVEYECEHEDAGGSYAHLPKEGGWHYHNGPQRLAAFLEEQGIETTEEERESLEDEILDDCEFRPGHILSSTKSNEFSVDSYAVGEVEDQYCFGDLCRLLDVSEEEGREFVAMAKEDNRFCLCDNGDGGVLSYTNTDAVWEFYVTADWIKERLEWAREN